MHCHIPCSSEPHLPIKVGSDAAMCATAPDLAFLRGWLQRCHVFRGPRPRLLAEVSSGAATCSSAPDFTSLPKWTSALPRVPCLQTLPPRGETSGVATYPTTPSGLWTTGIKKCLATLGTQLGSRIFKACSRVTEVPARRVHIQRHHNLQDVRTCRYNATQQCSIVRLPTHKHSW
jgi:hypothetical protein